MNDDLPWWPDDPRVPRDEHRLSMILDPVSSAAAGRDLFVGECLCGKMNQTPAWADYAVLEAYDSHMCDVQRQIHGTNRGGNS
jgi:hypothetical protein